MRPLNAGRPGLKILSLTTCYPNALDPVSGTFIRARLQWMSAGAEICVVAPVPVFDYSRRRRAAAVARRREDGGLRIFSPRWFYPPLGGVLNGFCLFAQLVGPIRRLRAEFPFQAIDAHFGHPEGIAAALLSKLFGCPFTVTLRGSEVDHASRAPRRVGMGWALRRASRVIAVSERLRRFAGELGVDERRVVVIPNGVHSEIFHPRDRESCRRAFDIAPSEELIVSAGGMVELKGHHRTVAAVKSLVERGRPVRLLIAGGTGPYESVIRGRIAGLALEKQVRLVGVLAPERLAELMAAADVFCLASRREGWPNVVHEALACGTPVVATDVGSVPELLPSPAYGIIVPPNDTAGLSAGLDRALDAEWDRAAIAGWGASRSWRQVAAEVLQLFEEIASPVRS
jgi:teichuronic acid biosynthesis glycosyltransferase TuaC